MDWENARGGVQNSGEPIPKELGDCLFQKFSSLETSQGLHRSGTGLGLWISKVIVEKLGGHIGFESNQTHGTTSFFDLPEWKGAQLEAASQSVGSSPVRILICQDEQ